MQTEQKELNAKSHVREFAHPESPTILSGHQIPGTGAGMNNVLPDFTNTLRQLNDKVNYQCFEITGSSMDDNTTRALLDKDVVVGKKVNLEIWKSNDCIENWNYAIIYSGGSTIKQITGYNRETGQIKCHSLNPIFKDFKIDVDNISELYIIIKIISRNMKRRQYKNELPANPLEDKLLNWTTTILEPILEEPFEKDESTFLRCCYYGGRMNPTIAEGDFMLMKKKDKIRHPGDIYMLQIGTDYNIVCRPRFNKDKSIIIMHTDGPDEPNEVPTKLITGIWELISSSRIHKQIIHQFN